MTLSEEEIERYARHIVLSEIGGAGQQKLKAARVLVVGAGGLGSPVIAYLAAAGIGTIGIVDDDMVSLSNLQRQIVHDSGSVGMGKTQSAANSVARQNPHVRVEQWPIRLTRENAYGLAAQYDIVADGSDNYETRAFVADCCADLGIPMVSAAVGRFDAMLTTLKPYAQDADGLPCPSYRDWFPKAPPPGALPSCAEVGIVGALTGVMGSMQALEVIKEITGAGQSLAGKLLLYEALECRFQLLRHRPAG